MEVNQIGRFDDSEAGRLTDREIELQSAAEIAVLRDGCRVKVEEDLSYFRRFLSIAPTAQKTAG
jgi:hypothetical protein